MTEPPSLPPAAGRPRDDSVGRLVAELASAESSLQAVVAGQVDTIVNPEGYAYLLHEAQRAILDKLEEARGERRKAMDHAAILGAVLDNAPDFITHVGRDRRIRFVNRAPAPLTPEVLVGTPWSTHALLEHQQGMDQALGTVLEKGVPMEIERTGPGENGTVAWYSSRIGPVKKSGEIDGAVIISRDITERKSAEARLMVSERMASVGTLAAGVAHEINNPLAAVVANLGYVQQAMTKPGTTISLPPDVMEALDDARTASDRVRVVVRDLKLFSRGEEDKRGPVDVERVLESTARMAWNEIRHRARLIKEFGGVPPVDANESRLGQVFLNLIVNAAQAIREGNYEGNSIRLGTEVAPDGRVIVTIADTGNGMTEEVRRKLFTPFFSTKPVGQGTGLGLAISHRIVTQLGGEIHCDSTVGHGTVFRILLPVARHVSSPVTAAQLASLAVKRGRVLVVDDEASITSAARRTLSENHFVQTVNSATEAHQLIVSGERFDVILCDLMMPQVTGMDLHGLINELDPKQAGRMVFMTGAAFTPAARRFLDEVPNSRIEKPFDFQGLRTLVDRLMQQ
jgi:PAS domain S-box-containing protein